MTSSWCHHGGCVVQINTPSSILTRQRSHRCHGNMLWVSKNGCINLSSLSVRFWTPNKSIATPGSCICMICKLFFANKTERRSVLTLLLLLKLSLWLLKDLYWDYQEVNKYFITAKNWLRRHRPCGTSMKLANDDYWYFSADYFAVLALKHPSWYDLHRWICWLDF